MRRFRLGCVPDYSPNLVPTADFRWAASDASEFPVRQHRCRMQTLRRCWMRCICFRRFFSSLGYRAWLKRLQSGLISDGKLDRVIEGNCLCTLEFAKSSHKWIACRLDYDNESKYYLKIVSNDFCLIPQTELKITRRCAPFYIRFGRGTNYIYAYFARASNKVINFEQSCIRQQSRPNGSSAPYQYEWLSGGAHMCVRVCASAQFMTLGETHADTFRYLFVIYHRLINFQFFSASFSNPS